MHFHRRDFPFEKTRYRRWTLVLWSNCLHWMLCLNNIRSNKKLLTSINNKSVLTYRIIEFLYQLSKTALVWASSSSYPPNENLVQFSSNFTPSNMSIIIIYRRKMLFRKLLLFKSSMYFTQRVTTWIPNSSGLPMSWLEYNMISFVSRDSRFMRR